MKRFFLSLILSLFVVFTATPLMAAMPFTDVKTSDWFYNEVQFVYDNGIFDGTSDSAFEPNTKMTRAMFVTVLGRMSGIDPGQYTDCYFDDVEIGSWYAPYVQWAYEEGITNGISSDSFGSYQPVTREQMAKFIIDYADYRNMYFTTVSPWYEFNDEENIASWADYYVNRCQDYGLLTGKLNNCFEPKMGSTRAEVATVIHRMLKAAGGDRIILYYMNTKIPTYDSVTLDFCAISAFYYEDYVQTSYLPWADTFIYEYDPNSVMAYYNYLETHGFVLQWSNVIDGNTSRFYQKNSDKVLITEVNVDGIIYTTVFLANILD